MQLKSLIIIGLFASIPAGLAAQNVGIGMNTPTRAKLELNGLVGNTTAIFGAEGNGIGRGAKGRRHDGTSLGEGAGADAGDAGIDGSDRQVYGNI